MQTLRASSSLKWRLVSFNIVKSLLRDHAHFNVAIWLILLVLFLFLFLISLLYSILSTLLRLTKFLEDFLTRNLVNQNTWHFTKLVVTLAEFELDFHLCQIRFFWYWVIQIICEHSVCALSILHH